MQTETLKWVQELTLIMDLSYDSDYKQFADRCGSKNCVGYIVENCSGELIVNSKLFEELDQ